MLSSIIALALTALPAVLAATYNVTVGSSAGALVYSPNQLNASAGDTVQFNFVFGNHSVTQSSFAAPCNSSNGFNSGYEFVGNTTNYLSYNLTINNTDPVYIYCIQGVHCARGMVMGINISPSNFTAFQAAANATAATTSSSSMSMGSATSSMMMASSSGSGTTSASASSTSRAAAVKNGHSAGIIASAALLVLSTL